MKSSKGGDDVGPHRRTRLREPAVPALSHLLRAHRAVMAAQSPATNRGTGHGGPRRRARPDVVLHRDPATSPPLRVVVRVVASVTTGFVLIAGRRALRPANALR
ncbi:hypothetical protein SUDANB95_06880 [Actinosynnema sp. ALI-1.44]